jgi:mannose/fructose/N-acetylgalactosamine-specific phosphotransferase system component IID
MSYRNKQRGKVAFKELNMKAFTISITIALILGIFAVADMTESMVSVRTNLAMQKEIR